MSKLPKAKRDRLILVSIGAAVVLAVIFCILVDPPRTRLKAKLRARAEAQKNLDKSREQIAEAAKIKAAVETADRKLQAMETRMPAGDPYRWMIKAFLDFPAASNVLIANIEAPHVSESTALPKVPHKTANFTLTGTAYYHEFGTFLAALENHFPHMRVKKVDLFPAYPGEADSTEAEKLTFQMDIAIFFKPAPAQPSQLSLAPSPDKRN